jgi:hypothetical protein
VHAKQQQLGAARDEWVESLRAQVRSKPLFAVVAAVALGAVMARFTRITR